MGRPRIRSTEERKAIKRAEYAINRDRYLASTRRWRIKHSEQAKLAVRNWHKKHPERCKELKLLQKYGISLAEYNMRFEKQGGVCAICHRPPGRRALSVDHNHETNENRGLLCDDCNLALGGFHDSKQFLKQAICYLEDYDE
jgi:hypothetical protein